MFVGKSSDTYEAAMEQFKAAARILKEKTIFAWINTDVEENKLIMRFFGLSKKDTPTIRLYSLKNKYKPELTEIKTEALVDFVKDFFDNKIKPFLLTQDLPVGWDAQSVKVLVGKNFDQIARDTTKNVLVEFYGPLCGK